MTLSAFERAQRPERRVLRALGRLDSRSRRGWYAWEIAKETEMGERRCRETLRRLQDEGLVYGLYRPMLWHLTDEGRRAYAGRW